MKIRFIRSYGFFERGAIVDMAINVAELYVNRGIAEYVEEVADDEAPREAQRTEIKRTRISRISRHERES